MMRTLLGSTVPLGIPSRRDRHEPPCSADRSTGETQRFSPVAITRRLVRFLCSVGFISYFRLISFVRLMQSLYSRRESRQRVFAVTSAFRRARAALLLRRSCAGVALVSILK